MKRLAFLILVILSMLLIAACSPSATSIQSIAPRDYLSQFSESNKSHILIDVRTPQEYADGHIAGSVNIPLDELSNHLSEISTELPIVVYCRSGNRSAQAASLLANAGYTEIYDLGGIVDWVNAGLAVE